MTDHYTSWEDAVLWLKSRPDQLELVRDCFYDDPLIAAAERYYASTEWHAVKQLIANCQKGTALDIGAGRGISSFALVRDGWRVTALEPDPGFVVGAGAIRLLATGNNLDISVIESWGERLPFSDYSYDLVYSRQALHHANDLDSLCSEIFRVLKPGGVLLATREHVISRSSDLAIFLARHPLHGLYGGEHAYLLNRYRTAISGSGIMLLRTLATFDSDINLYPGSVVSLKRNIENKLKVPVSDTLFRKLIVPILNLMHHTPGRLYTFIGQKP